MQVHPCKQACGETSLEELDELALREALVVDAQLHSICAADRLGDCGINERIHASEASDLDHLSQLSIIAAIVAGLEPAVAAV